MSKSASSLITACAGRRGKWATIVVWLIIGVFTLPFAGGKLNEVSTDDSTQFLPRSAEAAQLVKAQDALRSKQTMNVIAVWRKQAGDLTESDRQRIEKVRIDLVAKYPAIVNPAPVAFATDGQQASLTLYIPKSEVQRTDLTYSDSQIEALKEIRAIAHSGFDGYDVAVTGGGAFSADIDLVNQSVNGPLLIGTLVVVTLVLLLTYRSPFLWLLPIVVVGFGDGAASWIIYQLAKAGHLTLDGQSANIVPVLAFGVGTDYALLLLARYRDELRRHGDHHDAMSAALRRSGTTILASATIVVFAMLSLLLSDLRSNQALAVVGALSIGIVGLASATLLPALLSAFGRRVFWPRIPEFGSDVNPASVWSRWGTKVVERPVRYLVLCTTGLVLLTIAGLSVINPNLKQIDSFRVEPESVKGQKLINDNRPGDGIEPVLLITNTRQLDQVRQVLANDPAVNIAAVIDESIPGPNARCAPDAYNANRCSDLDGKTQLAVKMNNDPDTPQGQRDVHQLRELVHTVAGADAVVGSGGALRMDLADAAQRDRNLVIPAMLIAALVVFALLLRSLVAPLVLISTTLLSYLAALAGGALISRYLFHFPAEDTSLVLISFVFLVSLGIDYNVFLAARTRENASSMNMRQATLEALTSTGAVITSAGAVLAATFLVLASTDVVFVTQLGVTVALGVLIDTLLVRTVLVPAIFVILEQRTWWPTKLTTIKTKAKRATS